MTTGITVLPGPQPVFILRTPALAYILRVDAHGDLVHSHFGAPTSSAPVEAHDLGGWVREQCRREFPDVGRGDMRLPAVHIAHASGHTVSHFVYASHRVVEGKPALVGQPHTHGDEGVSTLLVELEDAKSGVGATLRYSVFARGAIVRSVSVRNDSKQDIRLERLASLALDFASGPLEMVHHFGNWSREFMHVRRKVEHGNQG
jgi:alpha-galactosidase